MTDDEIDGLSPDELRVEVAKMLGWLPLVVGNYPWQMCPPGSHRLKVEIVPDYPRNIAAAWELIEELRATHHSVNMLTSTSTSIHVRRFSEDAGVQRDFGIVAVGVASGYVHSEHHDCIAICRAYLKTRIAEGVH